LTGPGSVSNLSGAAAAAAATIIGPIANADPNPNAIDHANSHAQDRSHTVAGVAGDGPGAAIGAIQGFRPDVRGLSTALSHVPPPTMTTPTTVAPTP
jgi:hypothetical protein